MTPIEVADAVILLAFVIGLLLAVGRLTYRLVNYSRHRQTWPRLAVRDIIAFGGLLLPFLLILGVRGLELTEFVAGQLWWRFLTGIPALVAVWTLVYFEWRVIERRRH